MRPAPPGAGWHHARNPFRFDIGSPLVSRRHTLECLPGASDPMVAYRTIWSKRGKGWFRTLRLCYTVAHEKDVSSRTPHSHVGVGTRGCRRWRDSHRTAWRTGGGTTSDYRSLVYALRQKSADFRLDARDLGPHAAGQRQNKDHRRGSRSVSTVYLDTSYLAKFYFNEPESPRIRKLVRRADIIHSSVWALAEFHGVVHRRLREGSLSSGDAHELSSLF